jgi:hypothetical protein
MKKNNINEISLLIEKITPLNNEYRDLVDNSSRGVDVLIVMWSVGGLLEDYVIFNNLKPHNLYWQIYGKADGLKRSYITRDFLSYCLRIKRYFVSKDDIVRDFAGLQIYSLFREAFPLLENLKFKLSTIEREKLIELLNSKNDPRQIKRKILEIKKKRIGITNTRKQKLNEMALFVDSFVECYNNTYSLIKNGSPVDIKKFRQQIQEKYLQDLSQLISALTQEGLFVPKINPNSNLPKYWCDFILKLSELFLGNIEMRNRFRRLVAPKKIMQLSDMVAALTDDASLGNYKKRNNFI